MKLFLQKKCKIFERWGLRPHTPVPPAAGGFSPKPPASGGWGLRPQTPKTAPPLRISGYAPGHNNKLAAIALNAVIQKIAQCLSRIDNSTGF